MSNKEVGLHAKYEVSRLEDLTGKHDACRYFVLDPQHDPIALIALEKYAEEANHQGYFRLADDLATWMDNIDG